MKTMIGYFTKSFTVCFGISFGAIMGFYVGYETASTVIKASTTDKEEKV